ncbi:hypothetical protein BDW_06035 [Bdellovibrio bacteriovorus W]|nr:hypothetical protein BDW_06035 [Bdellovibrio bacteriovorus W]
MDYLFFKTAHIISIVFLLLSFVFILFSRSTVEVKPKVRKYSFMLHGVAWLLVFITAFGLVSSLGLGKEFPGWAKMKTYIWIFLGIGAIFLAKKPQWNKWVLPLLMLAGCGAIWLAVYKP